MKNNDTPKLPTFGRPSKEVSSAAEVRETVLTLHAILNFSNKHRAFQTTPEYEHASTILRQELEHRLRVLLAHYNIPQTSPDKGLMLAAALACELIPGFDPYKVSRRGRPRSVREKHSALALAILNVCEEKGVGISGACRALTIRNGPWKKKKPAQLQAAFYRFKDTLEKPRTDNG